MKVAYSLKKKVHSVSIIVLCKLSPYVAAVLNVLLVTYIRIQT